MKEKIVLAPQKGPQEMFLATSADICIYGGAAGGGKTFGLLLEPLRYMNNPDYNATIFRRDYTQVTSPGGLWDSSRKIYRYVKGSQPLKTPKLHWTFKRGASVNFAHLGRDEDCDDWQGSQLTMIGFDELTHFSEYQFFYMLSRNRTDSGVRPFKRLVLSETEEHHGSKCHCGSYAAGMQKQQYRILSGAQEQCNRTAEKSRKARKDFCKNRGRLQFTRESVLHPGWF